MVKVFISIGTNIDREANLGKASRSLTERFGPLQMSRVYESKAIGFYGENFFNQVLGFYTEEPPGDVVLALHEIERQMGRVRTDEKFSSRTVDLDLLLYGDLIEENDEFKVPRAEITENAFVLLPLSEIAGDLCHPVIGQSYRELWRAFNKADQEIWASEFLPDL